MRRIFLLAACLVAGLARADAPAPADRRPMQVFGAEHPDCLGWTDGCVICTQKACSTPGIACTPHEPVCDARAEQPPVAPPSQKP